MGSVAPQKPTIVLVHGAWHTADYWSAVIEQLKQNGYPSRTVSLPSVGGELTVTVQEDASHIQRTLSELVQNGEDIVIVMHSYGGLPGTESVKGFLKKEREAEGKTGGVVSLVYVSAFLVPEGFSLASFLGEMPEWVKFDGERVTTDPPIPHFYNDLPEAEAVKHAAKLQHHAKPAFYTSLTYAAYQHLPVSYLFCEQDAAIPLPGQQAMAGIAGPGVTTHVCTAGHSPMLSMPEKVVEVIRGAASEVVA